MASISTAGVGSGIDIQGLVGKLIDAERAPVTKRLDKQEIALQAKLSGFGSLKSALSSFQGALSELKFASTFSNTSTTSSDDTIATATGSSIAKPGSYSLEITNIAQAQSLSSKSFTETTAPVGTGTLSFQFGHFDSNSNSFVSNPDKAAKTVTINSGDNSVQGIRDAVNKANIGVKASLVNDGSGFKLLFTSKDTGQANGLKISVSDSSDGNNTDNNGLSQLAFDPDPNAAANSHLSENLQAKDALFTLNGLTITSASNSVSTAVSGVTLSLKGATQANTPINIKIAKNNTKIVDAVTNFTKKFNELEATLKQLNSYDPIKKTAGPLLGDSVIRTVESKLRNILSSSVRDTSGHISSLASVGLTTDRTGKLSLNTQKLQQSINQNRDTVALLFSAKGITSDSQIHYITSSKDTQTGTYGINIDVTASRGTLAGTATTALSDLANTPLVINSTNDSMSLLIDGVSTGQISIAQKSYTSGADLAAEIQAKINLSDSLKNNGSSVLVDFSNGQLTLSSALYGNKSSIEITSITGANDLGLSVGSGIQGTDVKGRIGDQQATSLGTVLTAQGKAKGIILEVTGSATGNRGNVVFNRGIADQLDTLISNFLRSNSLIDSRTSGINDSIGRINTQRKELDNKLSTLQARLFKQFNAMDAIVAKLQTTGNFLTQQLSNNVPTR